MSAKKYWLGRLSDARLDHRLHELGRDQAFVARGNPVVDQDFHGPPHDDPARDHEAFLEPRTERARYHASDQLREHQLGHDQEQRQSESEQPRSALAPARAANSVDHVFEMGPERVLDLFCMAMLIEPEHDALTRVCRQVFAYIEEVPSEAGVEVAFAKQRGVAIVKDLLEVVELDVDTPLPIPRAGNAPVRWSDDPSRASKADVAPSVPRSGCSGPIRARDFDMSWKKIMCPVDYSSGSKEALRTAATMAAEAGAELVIVHAWEPLYSGGEGFGLTGNLMGDLRKSVEESLELWRTDAVRLGAKRVTSMFLTGAPWNEIVGAAKSDPAIDLIVMGTHGRTGLKHVLIGSVAEKVVRHAVCPVLVIRSRD